MKTGNVSEEYKHVHDCTERTRGKQFEVLRAFGTHVLKGNKGTLDIKGTVRPECKLWKDEEMNQYSEMENGIMETCFLLEFLYYYHCVIIIIFKILIYIKIM